MADLPVPRSYNSILSDIIDGFLSRLGLRRLKIGGPILSLMEAVAQSDVRSSQDIFNLLDAQSIDRATGVALDNSAADENLTRIPVTAATGLVNFLDTSFTKISSSVYQGSSAPNIGTIALKVADATSFPTTGSVYIGRGTINYEGPLTYTAKVFTNPYWTLTLSPGTTKFHNLGESIIVAKGGVRVIAAGTNVQTPQGNVSDAVKFSSLYVTQIEDGETTVESIEVVADKPGIIGNVPAGAIREVVGAPYIGASVINSLPFTNGLSAEEDSSLRERIKAARQSRSKGTTLAIATGVKGVTSKEDNKTVISASIVSQQGNGSTLYIDDGTGYEESSTGVATETLMDSALGGEQLFQLSSQRPIAKAFLLTNATAPFLLASGDKLAIKVGGVLSEHSFSISNFRSISDATAYEVVASINGNPTLTFAARTSDNGTKVAIFAKTEENEEIEVVVPSVGNDGNVGLSFPVGINYTLRLYKNEDFLFKDGKDAIIESNSQGLWGTSITDGDTLTIIVDGTTEQTITFNNADFINNSTGYTTVASSNSLESWATVFDAKITGVTTVALGGKLTLTSNLNKSSRAGIEVTGGTLVTKAMFAIADSVSSGANKDYTLDRNTGQLRLEVALVEGDSLVAATDNTRGYLQSSDHSTSTVTLVADANLWFAVDGNAEIIETAVGAATSLAVSSIATNRARYTGPTNSFGSTATGSYLQVGDWVVIWDPQFTDRGMWRVSALAGGSNYEWFEVERATVTAETKLPTSLGLVFVRSESSIQKITIPLGAGIPLTSIQTTLNTNLIGANSNVFRNTNLGISTNTYADYGDILLITADIEGRKLLLPENDLDESNPSHFATVESGNKETGTPSFTWTTVATVPSATTFTSTITPASLILRSGDMIAYRKRLDTSNNRYGANADNYEIVQDIVSGLVTTRVDAKTTERLVSDRFYAASALGIAADDNLSIILDKDAVTKNFNIPLYRNIRPNAGATYGAAAFEVRDVDSSDLFNAFNASGTNPTFFNDFALFMKARGKTHSTTVNKTILLRNGRYGSDGNYVRFAYANPSAPSQTLALTTNTNDGFANVLLRIPSGTEKTGLNLNGANAFTITNNRVYTGSAIVSIVRTANVVVITLVGSGVTNTHVLKVGDEIFDTYNEGTFAKGPKEVTAVTANSFSYAEVAANDTSATPTLHFYVTSKRPAGTTNTVSAISSSGSAITATIGTHVFSVGDTVYFQPGHTDYSQTVNIASGAKVLTGIAATTVTWAEATGAAVAVLIPNVDYTISASQATKVTATFFKAETAIGFLDRVGGNLVTAYMNVTPIFVEHPYAVGDIVYLSPGEADFPAGPKIITAVTSTTFSYTEVGLSIGSTVIQYFSSTSSDINLTGGGTPVVAGDIVHIDTATSFDEFYEGNSRVFEISSTSFTFFKEDSSYITNGAAKKINATANLRFFPLASTTAAAVVTWLNANASGLLTATLVPDNTGTANVGSAVITMATQEEFFLGTVNASNNGSGSRSLTSFPLYDGLNWVKTSNLVSLTNTTLALKEATSGELTAYNDFDAENLRLVPITVKNFKNYLSSTNVSGFASNSIVSSSSDGRKLQLGSSLLGSIGAVQISGGSGNSTSAAVYGSGSDITVTEVSTYSKATTLTSQTKGLMGDMYVSVQGTNLTPKINSINSGTTVTVTATVDPNEWFISLNAGSEVLFSHAYSTGVSRTYQIEKHGNFMAYIEVTPASLSLTSVREGDLVHITDTALSATNVGTFQVIRTDPTKHTFWVENPDGVEETKVLTGTVFITSYDSISPGDSFIVNSTILGAANVGSFTISRLNGNADLSFYVNGTMEAQATTTLGSSYVFIKIKEESPIRLIKKIRAIGRNASDANYSDIIFSTPAYASKISALAGSLIIPLDKLAFDTNIHQGLDAYSFNTGLLAEVNKVVYGDESNPTVYPGIQANGTNINISGPLIKRITVSLAIRLRTGVSSADIIDRVKSSVASVINITPVGNSIAISDLVSAANSIDGVLAVTILSPEYDTGNDLIAVQASEKPRVLDIAQDILVSIVA